MHRDIDRLSAHTYDVLVVGGGIYGLTIAYDAAQRGLTVALIEREDFGSGASFNHLRTIHGGLRYLQRLDVRRARESLLERRTLARIAPHAVAPLAFALPLYRSLTKGRLAMRAGLLLDALVGADRNRGVPRHLRLPAGRVLSKAAAIERFPAFRRRGLTGAAVWHDYLTLEPDRLTLAWAIAAAAHGAALANHVEATALLCDGARAVGARAVDRLTGRQFEIAARVTVNATGAAIDQLLGPLGTPSGMRFLKAINLITRRGAGDVALGGRARSGRYLFLVPWRRRALFGTWESERPCAAGDSGVSEAEVAQFIAELNDSFPTIDLRPDDVTLVHRGVVPAVVGRDGRVSLEGRQPIGDHGHDGLEGVISVAGTKYTTARMVAERVATRVLEKLNRPAVRCRTADMNLPGGDLSDLSSMVAEARQHDDLQLRSDSIPHLVSAYGSRYREVLALAGDRADWRTGLSDDSPVIGAQLIWAVRHEMAETLCDAVLRRTPLGALGYPGDAAAGRAADILGAERGWTSERKRAEIDTLRQFYAIGKAPVASRRSQV
jgi:glycerol-3-phosphate dehydrogenase